MAAYYNEHDPYTAQWLRNLIAAGHIAPGVVDERDIRDIRHDELHSFDQCHFFAGIGVWSHALRRAGWPDDRPIWTGSCPCQPFSGAGKQEGFDDERHLWPVWQRLIAQCRPSVVVGEQVASALDWLDLVSADMEDAGYAFGASDLCAAGFSGAHIRQRLYFVGIEGLAHPLRDGTGNLAGTGMGAQAAVDGDDGGLSGQGVWVGHGSADGGLADAYDTGRQLLTGDKPAGVFNQAAEQKERFEQSCGHDAGVDHRHAPMLGRNAADWLYCRDDKWRPVEPGTFPLVDAAASRVGRLRAYGNGLDAETATQFVGAVMECL